MPAQVARYFEAPGSVIRRTGMKVGVDPVAAGLTEMQVDFLRMRDGDLMIVIRMPLFLQQT